MSPVKKRKRFEAYTLMELLVVLTIIGILLSIGMAAYVKVQDSAMKKATEIELNQYPIAVYNYKMDLQQIPRSVDQLLDGGYINSNLSTDSWGTPYQIEYDENKHVIKIISAGPDKKFGTQDDIQKEENLF